MERGKYMIEVGLLDMLLEEGLITKDEYDKAIEELYKKIS
jgi:predicted RNA-binding protein associated with RNAse of E/G family